MEEISLWDKIEDGFALDKRLDSQNACGKDFWIIAHPSGERVLKPYHCGLCEDCIRREAINIKTSISSLAYVNQLNFIKAPPTAVDTLVNRLRSADYVRFPSSNGFDYLFSIEGPGNNFFESNIDWESVMSRRKGTRKTGKLLVFNVPEEEPLIPLDNIRVASLECALKILEIAKEKFNYGDFDCVIDNETDLVVRNNIISWFLIEKLKNRRCLVFHNLSKKHYDLPINFKFKYTVEKELTNA